MAPASGLTYEYGPQNTPPQCPQIPGCRAACRVLSPTFPALEMRPPRGYEALRRHRTTIVGASYFVTLCTRNRHPGLTATEPADAVARELHEMAGDRSIVARAWVIMPDHVHLFLRTTEALALGQIVGRLKAGTRSALALRGLAWQGNFYEHCIRPDEPVEDVLRYMFLNPYRAGLASATEPYRHYWISPEDAAWFHASVDDLRPVPEWLV